MLGVGDGRLLENSLGRWLVRSSFRTTAILDTPSGVAEGGQGYFFYKKTAGGIHVLKLQKNTL